MAGVAVRRTAIGATIGAALLVLLTACLPIQLPGESSNGMTSKIDTAAIAQAVTATSASIETTIVETSIDGLTTRLWVAPQITTAGFTAEELDAALRAAYEKSLGQVSTIEIATMDAAEKTIDVTAAATALGIQHTTRVDSAVYSTAYLDEAYGK